MEVYDSSEALLAYIERGSGADQTPDYPCGTTRPEVCGNVSKALPKRAIGRLAL